MTYQHYTAEFKAKVVLEILQGERELGEVAKEYNINPNLIRKWRTTFLERASQAGTRLSPGCLSPHRATRPSI